MFSLGSEDKLSWQIAQIGCSSCGTAGGDAISGAGVVDQQRQAVVLCSWPRPRAAPLWLADDAMQVAEGVAKVVQP